MKTLVTTTIAIVTMATTAFADDYICTVEDAAVFKDGKYDILLSGVVQGNLEGSAMPISKNPPKATVISQNPLVLAAEQLWIRVENDMTFVMTVLDTKEDAFSVVSGTCE